MHGRCRDTLPTSRLAGLLCLLAVLRAPGAFAQVPYTGCTDRAGHPVRPIVTDSGSYAGWATILADGTPAIYWNPKRQYSPNHVTQLFLYLHECAHHALGHVWRGGALEEQRVMEEEADCWAVELMSDRGMFRGREQDLLERDQRASPGDRIHLAGQAAVDSWHACLAARTDPGQWREVLDRLVREAPDSFRALRARPVHGAPGTSEAALDTPGTFDCEIRPDGHYVCTVFSGGDDSRVRDRFKRLTRILRAWLPAGWHSAAGPDQREAFRARDPDGGVEISLVATADHLIRFAITAP